MFEIGQELYLDDPRCVNHGSRIRIVEIDKRREFCYRFEYVTANLGRDVGWGWWLPEYRLSEEHPGIYDLLDTKTASRQFDVPESSITQACRNGGIPNARKTFGSWEFRSDEFRAWLSSRPGRGRRKGT